MLQREMMVRIYFLDLRRGCSQVRFATGISKPEYKKEIIENTDEITRLKKQL